MAAEQPKKPVGGAFGQFMAENRAAYLKEVKAQGLKAFAISKLGSERWKALADKAKYEKKYKEVKAQYDKDMSAFVAAGGQLKARKRKGDDAGEEDGGGKRRRKRGAGKDKDAPKRPAGGAYGRFLAANRKEFTEMCKGQRASAVTKLAGQKWKLLSEAEKKPFEEEYKKHAAEYKKAMETYLANKPAAVEAVDEDEDEDEDDEEEEEEEEEDEAPVSKKPAGIA